MSDSHSTLSAPAPIETRYGGYRFRSRLEARWAVFFDVAGIAWEYEPEGFVTEAGPYLPDFRIYPPFLDFAVYVEVKPPLTQTFSKPIALSKEWPTLLCLGLPEHPRASDQLKYVFMFKEMIVAAWWMDYEGRVALGGSRLQEPGVWYGAAVLNDERRCPYTSMAYEKAHGARFEHGECG